MIVTEAVGGLLSRQGWPVRRTGAPLFLSYENALATGFRPEEREAVISMLELLQGSVAYTGLIDFRSGNPPPDPRFTLHARYWRTSFDYKEMRQRFWRMFVMATGATRTIYIGDNILYYQHLSELGEQPVEFLHLKEEA